jgi:hypothetical protein
VFNFGHLTASCPFNFEQLQWENQGISSCGAVHSVGECQAERHLARTALTQQRSALMAHYYFHLENGQILLDDTGLELRDIAVAQNEALRASGEILRAGAGATATLWNGTPWRMWVTDKPNGEGKTFFTLRLSAAM